jgi:ubiquinone/menaquinone biosynthesis C-methylase UbiE
MKKKPNHLSEEAFHDSWAKEHNIDYVDVETQFRGITSPEYKQVISYVGNVKNKRVLVLGCGLGEEVVKLKLMGAHVTAIDISREMLNATKRLARRYGIKSGIIYKHITCERLSFPKESFNAIVGCAILHHVDIKKTITEALRVLKPRGTAVFLEPLIYNPIINIYRTMASDMRTDGEHPLSIFDVQTILQMFPSSTHKEFQLTTLLIFIWFYIGERLHPNNVRYWKKIISQSQKYARVFNALFTVDSLLLTLIPPLRWLCWVTVIRGQKR